MDENVRGRTIGQRIFSEIDDNPYLNKLYSGLLYNYAIKLFKLTGVEERPVKLMDVLRFADLLSKCLSLPVDPHQLSGLSFPDEQDQFQGLLWLWSYQHRPSGL